MDMTLTLFKDGIPIRTQSAIFVGTACTGGGRGRQLPQRITNTPAEPPPCRLDIIFDFEMVLMVFKTYLQ